MRALGQVLRGPGNNCGCICWGRAARTVMVTRGCVGARGWGGGLRKLRGCFATAVRLLWRALCSLALPQQTRQVAADDTPTVMEGPVPGQGSSRPACRLVVLFSM